MVVAILAPVTAAQAYESPTTAFSAGGASTQASGLVQTWAGGGDTSLDGSTTLSSKGYTASMYSPAMTSSQRAQMLTTDVTGCPRSGSCSGLGTVTLSFSQPVLDPVLHLGGLGGSTGGGSNAIFHDTFTLATSGLTLTRLSGTNLSVSGTTITASNHSASPECDSTAGASATAVCGSVRVNGLVSSVKFNVGAVSVGSSGTIPSGNEDQFLMVATVDTDFGDAPTAYDNTASHVVGSLRLGSAITADRVGDSANDLNATAGDKQGANADIDSDDGVTLASVSTLSTTYATTVALSGVTKAGRVCGYIDFNKNNSFANANEQACAAIASGDTSATLTWTVPAGTTAGSTVARFRVGYTASQVNSPTGPADSGEVEDHKVTLVTPVAPNAVADTRTTPQGVAVTLSPAANDTADATTPLNKPALRLLSGTSLVTTLTVAGQGTYTVDTATGDVTFTPVATFVGTATPVSYRVADSAGRTTDSTITITTTKVTPDAVNDTTSTAYNTAKTISVLANDTAGNVGVPLAPSTVRLIDGGGNPVTTVTVAGQGTYTVNTSTGAVTFTPVAGYVGTALPVTYRVADANGTTDTATLTVTVNLPAAPVANPDTATTPQNVDATVNPLGNDSAATGVTLLPSTLRLLDGSTPVTSLTVAGQGTYTVNASTGAVAFDPVAAFTGTATAVGYRVTDSTGQVATSTIRVTVTPITPTAVDNSASTAFNTATTVDVLANDSAGASSAPLDKTSVKLLDPADHTYRTSITTSQGSYTVNGTTGAVTFTPSTGYVGATTPMTYRVLDSNGTAATATLTIGVAAPAPPVAQDDAATTPQGRAVTLPLLGNDTAGPTGAALVPGSVRLKDPSDGGWKNSVVVTGQGVWSLDPATGAATFSPLTTFHGSATAIAYRVADTNSATTTATARVTVTQVTPTATPDTATTAYETAVTVPLLGNDHPGDSSVPLAPGTVRLEDPADHVWKSIVTIAGEGTYTVDATTGAVTFTPDAQFHGTGTTLAYRVADQNGTAAQATVTVTVSLPDLPFADADHATTRQGAQVSLDVLDNDHAGDRSSLDQSTVRLYDSVAGTWVTGLTVADEGSYTVDTGTGVVTFTPLASFTGTAAPVAYRIADEVGQVASSYLQVTVTAVTPTADDDTATTPYGHAVGIDVQDNDQPGDPDVPLVTSSVELEDPADGDWKTAVEVDEGTFEVQLDGSVLFTPADGFSGPVPPLTYRVADENGTHADAEIRVTVGAAPEAVADTATTKQDVAVTIDVLDNDVAGTGAGIDTASVQLRDPADGTWKPAVTIAGQGTWTVGSDGTVSFDPVPSFSGSATAVDYRFTDSDDNVATAQVRVVVTPVTPVAVDDTAATPFSHPVDVSVLGNDHAGDASAPLVPGSVQLKDPADGEWKTTVTIDGQGTYAVQAGGVVRFTPTDGFSGPADDVEYRVADDNGTHAVATVTVTVGAAPVAGDDTATTRQGDPVTTDVLHNDAAGTGATLVPGSLQLEDPADGTWKTTVTIPAEGTYTVGSDHVVTFAPVASFTGASSVGYRVTDSDGNRAGATLTVTVAPVVPTASDDTATTAYAHPVDVTVLGNDHAGDATAALVPGSVQVKDPADGTWKTTVTVSGQGTYAVLPSGVIRFTPAGGFAGEADAVAYRVADENGTRATAALTVTVGQPPRATDDSVHTTQDVAVTVDVLDNDAAGTGATLVPGSVRLLDPADDGWKTAVAVAGEGRYTVGPDGAVSFDPEPQFTGTGSIGYRVTDSDDNSTTATLSVVIDPVVPTAAPDTATTPFGHAVDVAVLGNDHAGDASAPLVAGSVRLKDPADGAWKPSVTLAGKGTYEVLSSGAVRFTPADGFSGPTGAVAYRVADDNGTLAESTVTVTVGAAPAAHDDETSTKQGDPVTVDVLDNDAAGTGATLVTGSVQLLDPADDTWKTTVTLPGEGAYVAGSDGRVTFTPTASFTGASAVGYRVADSDDNGARATLTVTVADVVPTASDDAATTPFAHPVDVTVLGNDHAGDPTAELVPGSVQVKDPADDTWKTTVTVPGQGTYAVQAGGVVRFTPADGFSGPADAVRYRVGDENGTHASAEIAVTVGAAPHAVRDEATTRQGVQVTVDVLGNDTAGTDATKVPGSVQLRDPADDTWTTSVTVDGEGTWTANPVTGLVTFAPVASFTGEATAVGYRFADSDGNVATEAITVTVTAVVPTAAPDAATTAYLHPVDVTVLGNDDEGDVSAPLDSSSVELKDPADGDWTRSVTVDGVGGYEVLDDGTVRFTPADGFEGTTSPLPYRVSDDNGTRAQSTITVTVTTGPRAVHDAATGPQGVPVTLPVLGNDAPGAGAEFDRTSVELFTPAGGVTLLLRTPGGLKTVTVDGEGTWTVQSDGGIVFAPEPGFTGTTTPVPYEFTDTDGNTARAMLTVVVVPVTPTASDDTVATAFGTPVTAQLLGNDHAGAASAPLDPSTVQLRDPADLTWKSSVTVPAVGTYTARSDGTVRFAPAAHFSGTAPALTYRVADGNGTRTTAGLVVTVGFPQGAQALPDRTATPVTGRVTIDPLVNDTASEGAELDPATLCLVASDGSCGDRLVVKGVGTWVVGSDGKVTFTPVKGYAGPAGVAYRVTDTNGVQVTSTIALVVQVPAAAPAAPRPVASAKPSGRLAFTGGELGATALTGLLLLGIGAASIVLARRRRPQEH